MRGREGLIKFYLFWKNTNNGRLSLRVGFRRRAYVCLVLAGWALLIKCLMNVNCNGFKELVYMKEFPRFWCVSHNLLDFILSLFTRNCLPKGICLHNQLY